MKLDLVPVAACVIVSSAILTHVVRRLALTRGLLDIPNSRSSHRVPTPKGGGVAIVLAATAAFGLLYLWQQIDRSLFAALLGGLGVALAGFIDDRREVRAGWRLAAHAAVAIWALALLGGLPPLRVAGTIYSFGVVGVVVGVLGIVWVLNLFNFMDGVDGIAASEGVFVSWGGALLAPIAAAGSGTAAAAWIVGAACSGFLVSNWPPAKIFMGDVGSGYLGYTVAVLALSAARSDPAALYVWLILGGVFFVDATATIARRLFRGERVYEAHRSHAYQWLARRWDNHLPVTLTVIAINLAWLLPWAVYARRHPEDGIVAAAIALLPLFGLALVAGAGRREVSNSRPT